MKNKLLLVLLVLVSVFVIVGCGKKEENGNNKTKDSLIIISDKKDKGYVSTFKTGNSHFVQENPKYNQIHNEELGVFISFDYIESTKEAYDYAKTHNLFGNEYAEGSVTDYKWNNYDGYTYGIQDNEMYFRILLEDDKDNCIVLTAFVGPKKKDIDFKEVFNSEEFQSFLNTLEFKKENK